MGPEAKPNSDMLFLLLMELILFSIVTLEHKIGPICTTYIQANFVNLFPVQTVPNTSISNL